MNLLSLMFLGELWIRHANRGHLRMGKVQSWRLFTLEVGKPTIYLCK
jgi:hypothetical protein